MAPIARRCIRYFCILLLAILLFAEIATFRYWSSPTKNLEQLSYLASSNIDNTNVFKSRFGYLKIYPNRGFIVVLYVGDEQSFSPSEFLIIFKKDSNFSVQLINGIGEENCVTLEGNAAQEYLKTHKVSLSELENVFTKNYCH